MEDDFLKKIVAHKRKILKEKKPFYTALKTKVESEPFTRYRLFKNAIAKSGQMSLIAEIKKASPSQGIIRKDFDVMDLARRYTAAGADAFSVLTEEKFFLGKPPFVRTISEHFTLPVLTKDFIIDELQIYETFLFGSSAILLIAAILTDEELVNLMQTAHRLDLDCLVEVHDENDLERVLNTDAEIIGVNNRDLRSFKVDLTTSERLIPMIPKNRVVVAESGIRSHEEILRLKQAGANAVLIGETFLRSNDIENKIKEVMYGR